MRDSLLSLTLGELRSEICRYFQFGRDYEALNDRQRADVDATVRRGLRQFLSPPPSAGDLHGHTWSFLRPTGTVVTEDGVASYAMPSNYGGIVGVVTHQSSETGATVPIEVGSMSSLRARKQSSPSLSARPEIAAIEPVSSGGEPQYPTRFNMILWPTPDAAYTLEFQYIANIEDLTLKGPETLLPGGQQHSETIIASCLAVAESMSEANKLMIMMQLFLQRLSASVSLDRRLNSPSNIGQNTDNSDGMYRVRRSASRVNYIP
jgi:hypothetical protein